MNCIQCSFNNPATVVYCQRCGQKIDLTADEIQASILNKAKGEQAATSEDNSRQMLFFAVVMFAIALTLLLAVGSVPEGRKSIPSAVSEADFVKVVYKFEPKVEKALVPFKAKRNP